jgi:hypothetical protein
MITNDIENRIKKIILEKLFTLDAISIYHGVGGWVIFKEGDCTWDVCMGST